ncbi:hypothetical protein D3C87_1661540 [compost metagenome]
MLPTIEASTATPTETPARRIQSAASCCAPAAKSRATGSSSRLCAPVTIPVSKFQSWADTPSNWRSRRAFRTAKKVHEARAPTAQAKPVNRVMCEVSAGAARACQPMQTAPAMQSNKGR